MKRTGRPFVRTKARVHLRRAPARLEHGSAALSVGSKSVHFAGEFSGVAAAAWLLQKGRTDGL
jgi:hypothetical protein